MQVQTAAKPLMRETKAATDQKAQKVQNATENPTEGVKASNPGGVSEASKTGGNSYLKVVSRLENLSSQDKMDERVTKGFAMAVENRIKAMDESQLKEIANLPDFKQTGIEDINDLPKTLETDLSDPEKSANLFKLLKNPEFAKAMYPNSNQDAGTYQNQQAVAAKPAAEQPAKVSANQPKAPNPNEADKAEAPKPTAQQVAAIKNAIKAAQASATPTSVTA